MILLEIVVLAIVQGITEFLPISSSGHVVALEALFEQYGQASGGVTAGPGGGLTVNIVLHVGTLLAILVFYWPRICRLVDRDRRLIGLLVVGSLPAAAVGVPLKLLATDALQSPLLAGCLFPVTGVMLLWGARRQSGTADCAELGYGRALTIGASQAFALLPGISRSGATIVAGLGCGLKREEAATFSFLLAIPAIGGAGLLELVHLLRVTSGSVALGPLLVGAGLSFAVGLASLWWLIRWLRRGRLHYFAWWVLPLGPIVIAWQLLSG